jgi:uroporphyrinogen III methyltransferase / synthase
LERGIVYLVGAGPGDPGLITLRGLECLRSADVVVYDRLAAPELLREAREGAELIPCGKEPRRHPMPQGEINRTLVEKALAGLRVCRLKGGDPIVFGRGAEEALELLEAGIPFEIVPGVSSSVAAGAYAGVPVTLRGVASSFAVVTGHEDPGKEQASVDWRALAKAVDTIVILMGVERAGVIAAELLAGGLRAETPVTCVSRATTPEQSTLVSSLGRLEEDLRTHNVTPPTVLIVGEVGALYPKLAWFEGRPLFGKRVLVTRTRDQASDLSRLLAEQGAQAIEMPVIRTVAPATWEPFDAVLPEVASHDWLVLTSANGVRAVRGRLRELASDVRALAGPRIAAIGPKTAEALEQTGLRVDLCPEESVGEALARAMAEEGLAGKRILLLRAEEGREAFPEAARDAGASVTAIPVYRTLPVEEPDQTALDHLDEGRIDVVTFASSSAVTNCARALGEDRARSLLARTCVACIGPVTAKAAADHGLTVAVQPDSYTVEALVEALVRHFAG